MPAAKTKKLTKAEIKKKQAAFVERIRTAQANEHQAAIFAAAESGAGKYVVLAGPGSGKTFTSIRASVAFAGKAIYFSFNKKIAEDTAEKLIALDSRMSATTVHAFGLSCLMVFTSGKCRVDDDKYKKLVKAYLISYWGSYLLSIQDQLAALDEDDEGADPAVLRLDALSWIESLVHYAHVSLYPPTERGLLNLVEEFDLEISRRSLAWPFVVQAVPQVIRDGQAQFLSPERLVSYDDMIYLPNVIEGVPVRQYDHILVDEAQDTSRAGLELILKASHKNSQVFFVGDPYQSIYAFAGAAFDSIDQIIQRLEAQTLPLKICYRCGSAIIDIANQIQPGLVSAGLHTGNVSVIPEAAFLDQMQPGDAGIGRTTKKLVEACLRVLQKGKRAKVLGRNLGDNIAAVVTRLEEMRISRGVRALQPDLSNFLPLLDEHHAKESKTLLESRKDPDMALEELSDKIETVRVFFQAYISKCNDESLRLVDDPECKFERSAKDFKAYITGLFSEEDHAKNLILFMTAHRSKGGEWDNVWVIHPEEFPHPRAKSSRQKSQERNLMYVTATRAIENLFFVEQPFECVSVPGYVRPEQAGLTILSYPAAEYLEVHRADGSVEVSWGDATVTIKEPVGSHILEDDTFHHDEIALPEISVPLTEGRVSRAVAIEVLCPLCNGVCVDPATGSVTITPELVGHTVICNSCKRACIVPLNAFSMTGNVIAREKPAQQVPNSQIEKKGRTQKERKSSQGRKTKGSEVRQPMQLSLDMKVIKTLKAMKVNASALFEDLLQQYEPFLEMWAAMNDDAELDHDEI